MIRCGSYAFPRRELPAVSRLPEVGVNGTKKNTRKRSFQNKLKIFFCFSEVGVFHNVMCELVFFCFLKSVQPLRSCVFDFSELGGFASENLSLIMFPSSTCSFPPSNFFLPLPRQFQVISPCGTESCVTTWKRFYTDTLSQFFSSSSGLTFSWRGSRSNRPKRQSPRSAQR